MKLLWISNGPWTHSGYGSQTAQAGSRIARAGYEIEFATNEGSRGDRPWKDPFGVEHNVRGQGGDRYSRDTIREDFERSGSDWVISLYDAWVYTDKMEDPFKGLDHVAGWVPVDHYPTPLALYGWLQDHFAIAMSRFGYDCLTATSAGFKATGRRGFPVRYVPHAVDDVFRPVSGETFREIIDIPPDAYLVGIVAANNGTMVYDRKGFGDMAHAMSLFMADRPDAYLYLHTIPRTGDGMDLALLMEFKGIDPTRIRWADQYALKKSMVSNEQMAGIYSSFDLLLATSRGEGFGLPVIEAQACGVPVIASNWTAQAELVGDVWTVNEGGNRRHPSGWLVAVDPDYDPRQGADFGKPKIGGIVVALQEAYERRGDASLRDAAIAKAADYRADVVFEEHWRPLLAEMEDELRPKTRQQRRAAAAKARRVA